MANKAGLPGTGLKEKQADSDAAGEVDGNEEEEEEEEGEQEWGEEEDHAKEVAGGELQVVNS